MHQRRNSSSRRGVIETTIFFDSLFCFVRIFGPIFSGVPLQSQLHEIRKKKVVNDTAEVAGLDACNWRSFHEKSQLGFYSCFGSRFLKHFKKFLVAPYARKYVENVRKYVRT